MTDHDASDDCGAANLGPDATALAVAETPEQGVEMLAQAIEGKL